LKLPEGFSLPKIVFDGVLIIQAKEYSKGLDLVDLRNALEPQSELLTGLPMITLVDDSAFTAKTINNFLWVTFTRSNPSHDVHGVGEFTEKKHWGCTGSIIIDARIKPHHAPPLIKNSEIEKKVDKLGSVGGSLHGII
jgi:4-hydroxy-3-polyprenylbenzoate decarboxylase